MDEDNVMLNFSGFSWYNDEDGNLRIYGIINIEGLDKMIELSLGQCGMALGQVRNQTENICIEAVKNNGMALEFVCNQTENICIEAVKNNGMALEFVGEQTENICIEAVKNNWHLLRYVKEQTEAICLVAVRQCCWAIDYIANETLRHIVHKLIYNMGDIVEFRDNAMCCICLEYSDKTFRFPSCIGEHEGMCMSCSKSQYITRCPQCG